MIATSGVSKPVAVAETFLNPSTQDVVNVRKVVASLQLTGLGHIRMR